MTKQLLGLLACLLLFSASSSYAQEEESMIGDDMTINPEQNAQWREGQAPYPAKPRNMWELGLAGGGSLIGGDVDGQIGWGAGLTFRKAINYVLSVRFGAHYTSSKGYDARGTSFNSLSQEVIFRENGGISGPLGGYQGTNIHRNYETNVFSGNLELLVSIGNILFHRSDPEWNAYVGLGLGYHNESVNSDLLNGSSLYNFESVTSGLDMEDRDDRSTARDNLKDLLDGDFESESGDDPTTGSGGLHGLASFGITRKLGDRVSLGLEYQVMVTGSDLLDAYSGVNSRSADIMNHFNVRIGFHLGSEEKRVQPLYWVNPLDAPMNDLAEVKSRPKFDLTDSDGDGVIDMIDQEVNSPAGCPVDTRGIILDSDGDGVADCQDQEPYSAPGATVDAEGVNTATREWLTESEVRTIVNARPIPKVEWFMPMVHFDLDKYYVKPEYYGELASIAQVLRAHPDYNLVVHGYSDSRGDDDYNNVLAYNRAEAIVNHLVDNFNVQRNRLIIQYGGSELITGLPSDHNTSAEEEKGHYMNRRVEFRIAGSGDNAMSRPEGEAGSDTPGSSRSGAKYSGNRNSGY